MIKSISLKDFRVFNNLKIKTNNSLVIFSGKNATGKTSILEAVYLLSKTKSHRTQETANLIKFDAPFSVCEVESDKRYKIVISKEGKSLFINDKEIKKTGEYLGRLNTVMISPSDILLVSGSKLDKRRFLDLNISTYNKKYLNESSKYKKLLNERNTLLKNTNVDRVFLDVITKNLCESLSYIYNERVSFLNKLNTYLIDISNDMNIEQIKLKYNPTYNPEKIYESFNDKLNSDIFNKITSIGSHRDDFKILINDLDASEYASEGQSRIIYIAIKLALKKILTELMDEPILLLDDIYQALDNKRIASLTKYVKSSKQAFITTTSILEIPDEILKDAMVIRMENNK